MNIRDKIYRTVVLTMLWIMYINWNLEFTPAMPRAAFWVGLIISSIGLGAIWLSAPPVWKKDEDQFFGEQATTSVVANDGAENDHLRK